MSRRGVGVAQEVRAFAVFDLLFFDVKVRAVPSFS
jgi:hypothetical protein